MLKYNEMPNIDAMMATGTNSLVAKVAPPTEKRAVFSSMNQLLRISKPEPDPVLGQALLGISVVRKNDDITLLFQYDANEKYYIYISGKSRNGNIYVGIMPYSVAQSHKAVAREMMSRFNVRIRDAKGGMVAIHKNTIFIFGKSGRYKAFDHESVKNAIRTLVHEADPMKIEMLFSLDQVPLIEGL
jgi:hypothetical protein